MMFPNLTTRLTKKTLLYIIAGLAVLSIALALGGCTLPNPGCGGARGC